MPTRTRIVAVALVAAMLLAGCSAGVDGPAADGGAGQTETRSPPAEATGTLAFYVSDQPNAIGDFERLAVTVTEIGVHRADDGNDTDDGSPAAESTGAEVSGASNDTTTNSTANSTDAADDAETDEEERDNESDAGWTTYAVDDRTVDLTELQGDNATRLANVSLAAGEYDGVYLAISNVNGTLTTGESVKVKLPSERLRLNKGFAQGANRSTSFVFDIAVHEAGGSGKYILRPVIGQSGPDVPIREVEGQGRGHGPADRGNGPQATDGEDGGPGGPPDVGDDRGNRSGSPANPSAASRGSGNSTAR